MGSPDVGCGTDLDAPLNMSVTVRQSGSTLGRVLVVDDDPDVRDGLCEFLVSEGYAVKSAADGAEAIHQLKRGRSDIVLLDLRMPGMDGYEFLRRREVERELRAIPVVVVSASTDEQQIVFPGVSMLRKPVEVQALLDLIAAKMAKPAVH